MPATPVMMSEDRRSLTVRLSSLQVIVAVIFGALTVVFWVFQVAQHEKFEQIAEENHLRRLPLPAPRGVLFDRNGKVLVDNQSTFNIALVREQTKDLDQTLHTLALATGADEALMRETVNRRRREPSYRPIVLIENAAREQWFAVARAEPAGHHLSARADAEIPGERTGRARLRLRRRGHRRAARIRRVPRRRAGRGRRPRRRREGVEPLPDGQGRHEGSDRQQPRAGDRRLARGAADRGAARAADHRRRRPEGHRRRLHRVDLQRRGGGARSAQRRGARVLEPAGLRSQRVCRGHRPGDVERAQHRRPAPAAEPRACRGATRPGRPSRWRWGSPAWRKGSSRPNSGPLPRRPDLLRTLLQVLEEGRPRLGRPPQSDRRSPATCTSTRSATCSASIASTSGRRSSGSA